MDGASRKELTRQYKDREVVGGIYAIRNTVNGKMFLGAATNIQSSINRFDFAMNTGSCIDPRLQKDWTAQNGKGFTFEVLEELKKGETQTDSQFSADINLLKEMWLEKLDGAELY